MTTKEINEIKAAVAVLSEDIREGVEKAIIDELTGGSGIKLNGYYLARNYILFNEDISDEYNDEYGEEDNAPSKLEFFLERAIEGIVVYSDNGEIKGNFDNSRITPRPIAEFIKEAKDIFEAYTDPEIKKVYNEILAYYGE